jgi:hypothetical protein
VSTDHRKPVVAFVVLAFLAAAVVGIHRADADGARFLASVLGAGQVDGSIPNGGRSGGEREGGLLAVPRGVSAELTDGVGGGSVAFGLPDAAGKRQTVSRGQARRDKAGTTGRQEGLVGQTARGATDRSRGGGPGRQESGKAVRQATEAAADAARGYLRRDRSGGDAARDRADRALRTVENTVTDPVEKTAGTVDRTAETVERTARTAVDATEDLVHEVGELAALN